MACKPHKGRAPVATSLTSQHVTGCGFDDSPAWLRRHGVLAAKFAALRRHAQGRARGSAGAQRSAWDVHWDWVKRWNGRYGLIWSYIHDPSRDRVFYGKSLENYCYKIVYIRHLPLIRGAKMNQGAKMNCCDRAIFLREMVKLTWNAEKHKICWKACFVVTVTCLFFLTEMVKLTWNAEKHKTCWKTCFVVTCFFDGNGKTYMKCWEAGHAEKQKIFAEKHVLLWHVYFFWKT